MSKVNRNDPVRAANSESSYTLMEFMREFPDDAACLDFLWRKRFAPDGHTADCPKCERPRRFHRVASRPSYSCDTCGHHLHPTAGTIFHRSATSLHLWFYAMYLITSTRGRISAKQLERELGVTYKTAWRIFNLIRNRLMDQGDDPFRGDRVEADETYFGGRRRGKPGGRAKQGRPSADSHKQPVFGIVQRGGKIAAYTVENTKRATLMPYIQRHTIPAAVVYTDEFYPYRHLGRIGYDHRQINHREEVYVSGDVHTNTIEGFFGNVKRGISGVYHSVSRKWLQGYLNEYAWRYNHRDDDVPMFRTLIARSAQGT